MDNDVHSHLGNEVNNMTNIKPISRLDCAFAALRELYDQVLSLDDYTLTRDLPQHEAQAIWDDAISAASNVLHFKDEPPAYPYPLKGEVAAVLWGEPMQLWDGRWVRYGSSTGATPAVPPSAA